MSTILFLTNPEKVTFVIKKKTVTLDQYDSSTGKVLQFPMIISPTKLGKITYKDYFIVGDNFYTRYGQMGGKFQISTTEGKIMNVGKKNETSKQEDAIIKCSKKWKSDIDKNYKIMDEDIDVNDVYLDVSRIAKQKMVTHEFKNKIKRKYFSKFRPMLAQKFSVSKKHVEYPCGASEKLDGARCISQIHQDFKDEVFKAVKESKNAKNSAKDEDKDRGYVSLCSRQGIFYGFMDTIREDIAKMLDEYGDINLILDGELYSHKELEFRKIIGTIRKIKNKSEHDGKVQYWIYDIYDESDQELPYGEGKENRTKIMKKLEEISKKLGLTHIRFIYYQIANDEEEILKIQEQYILDGFEGVMVRNLNGKYKQQYRSNDLMKFKEFEDGEFEITGAKEGKGREKGCIIFICDSTNERNPILNVRPKGEMEYRKKMWKKYSEDPDKFIGKMYTVKYQKGGMKDDSLPRFGSGREIKDFDHSMLEGDGNEDENELGMVDVEGIEIRDYE